LGFSKGNAQGHEHYSDKGPHYAKCFLSNALLGAHSKFNKRLLKNLCEKKTRAHNNQNKEHIYLMVDTFSELSTSMSLWPPKFLPSPIKKGLRSLRGQIIVISLF
jgi:hypothetical protein